jgi:hypothetical protein
MISIKSNSVQDGAAGVIQAHIRSYNRFQTHCRCLGDTPQRTLLPTKRMVEEVPEVLDTIHQLATDKAIISPVVSHITTEKNLSSICSAEALFGAEALDRRKITYTKNALGPGDIENGDGDIICCAHNLVDYLSLGYGGTGLSEGKIEPKEGLIHVKVDLSTVDPQKGIYNQFFKIKDFRCPAFYYQMKVVSWLSLGFFNSSHDNSYCIDFKVDDIEESVIVSNEEMVFYGDLYQINRFCLLSIFKFIEKSKNKSLVDAFYKNFKSSSLDERTKILKLYGQHLTVFSECNFNQRLTCVPGLFREIYAVTQGICYSLEDLMPEEYEERIAKIARGQFKSLPFEKKEGPYSFDEKGNITHILGRTLTTSGTLIIHLADVDYSMWDAKYFTGLNFVNFFEMGQISNSERRERHWQEFLAFSLILFWITRLV